MFRFYRKHKFQRLQNTLMIAFLVLSITPLTVLSLFFLNAHSNDLEEQSTSHLISVRDSKKQQIIDYLEAQESEVMGFVRSELAYASGGRFYGLVNAFKRLGLNDEEARENAQRRYVLGSDSQRKTIILPESESFVGSERYRLLHKRYHRAYLEHLKRSDFNDILLVDIDGNVTYSIYKNAYYGTNLESGDYKDSNLGKTYQKLTTELADKRKTNEDYTPVVMSDFEFEDGEQVAWLAAPIIQQGYLHSYALMRLPNNGITKLIEESSNDSLKTLLAGSDKLARSSSHNQDEVNANIEIIEQTLKGETSVGIFTDTSGDKLIAAYTPVELQDTTWALIVETPERIAFARVHQLEKIFVIAMIIGALLVVIASHYLSNFITSPLLKLTWVAEKVSAGDLDEAIKTDRKDEIGRLATSFERMQRSIREKIQLIKAQNKELEANLKTIRSQNEELHLADKLKDEFLATTSHELRTPLHGMVGIAEAMVNGANGPIPAHQKYQLEIIINSGQRLTTLVDDLLDYHKMRYGNLTIQTSAVDIASATRLVLELSNHLLGKKPIRIINQVPIDSQLVAADAQRLEQVMYNLIGNAIKYTSEGKIVISATTVDDQMRVQVVDTGQGIPSEYLEQIFEPLTQAGFESQQYRQGAGLGLSISRQLIELMGGALYVSSQPMVGTTFSFTLPLATEDMQADLSEDQPIEQHFQTPETLHSYKPDNTALPENPDGPLIAVADDEPVNLQVLESFLRIEGYRVQLANDGSEILKAIEDEKPELLLLDVMMPGKNGYEVCESLREKYDHSELPIIMLTALSQNEDRIKGFQSGANDYLTKPFNKQELGARIQAHLAASKAEQRRVENQLLQLEIKQREITEANLLETQGRLLEQLESAPEAIVCVREDKRIRFANNAATRLFKRSSEQLKRSNAEEIISPKFLHVPQEHYCGQVDIYVDDIRQHVSADILRLPEGSDIESLYIFDMGGGADISRVRNLETAVEALSTYAFEGDKNQLQQLKELGGEFTRIADRVSGENGSKQDVMRELLVDSMVNALDYWESTTGHTKFSFAEQSGLWRVYLDRSTLQTRTLDKYLRVETLPKTPRWRTVLNSIDYILEHCKNDTPQRAHLIMLRDKLQKLLTT